MSDLPKTIKLSSHARQRLEERKSTDMKYYTQNIMRSSVKWYGKNDLIQDCALYRHCCYVTRKSNQMGYMTDGDIEILYNKNTHVAVTVLEVKEKFKPISQFFKPHVLDKIKMKKEKLEMRKKQDVRTATCTDCGETTEVNSKGICAKCSRRKVNMKARNKEYVPYIQLSEKEKQRINSMRDAQEKLRIYNTTDTISTETIDTMPSETTDTISTETDYNFLDMLKEYGCEIPEESLSSTLNVLSNTDKLKDILTVIAENDNQQAMLDLEQALNVAERKLQHEWEYNGFQSTDDEKFKKFLVWRRTLKSAIFFWKKLYQTNTVIEMQRAWNAYTQDPNEKILLAGEKINSTLKRYQITTESVSNIFNTRRPFTRVFYAQNKDSAYKMFIKWMSDRNLHENPKKTTIVELNNEGERIKEADENG